MVKQIINKLQQSILHTLNFFEGKLRADGSYGAATADISCYFKSPQMFILADKLDKANSILNYIQKKFLQKDGDFKTASDLKSNKPEYNEYWTYINGWIVRAALQAPNHTAITEPGCAYLQKFYDEQNNIFLTHKPDAKCYETDILTTAHLGLLNLELGNKTLATTAADFLCEVLNQQPDLNKEFYLRFNKEKKPIVDFSKEKTAFYTINKIKPHQLYFMLGYPAAYLAAIYQSLDQEIYLTAAKKYVDFALSCNANVFSSNFSHKIAWACSILYMITREKHYLEAVNKITQHFLNIQYPNGLWYQEADINTAYDQSAEITCWFIEIVKNLEKI